MKPYMKYKPLLTSANALFPLWLSAKEEFTFAIQCISESFTHQKQVKVYYLEFSKSSRFPINWRVTRQLQILHLHLSHMCGP